jgi:hypothetical protein
MGLHSTTGDANPGRAADLADETSLTGRGILASWVGGWARHPEVGGTRGLTKTENLVEGAGRRIETATPRTYLGYWDTGISRASRV